MLHPLLTGSLNRDICAHTFGFLDKCALAACRQVCTTWRDWIPRPAPWTVEELENELTKAENPAFVHLTQHLYLVPSAFQDSTAAKKAILADTPWVLDWIRRRSKVHNTNVLLNMPQLRHWIATPTYPPHPRVCAWYWDVCQSSHEQRVCCFWDFFFYSTPEMFCDMLKSSVVEVKRLCEMGDFFLGAKFFHRFAERVHFATLQSKWSELSAPHWGVQAEFWESMCEYLWRDTRRNVSERGVQALQCIGRALGKLPKRFCLGSQHSAIYDTKRMHDQMTEWCSCPKKGEGPRYEPNPSQYPTPALLSIRKRTREDEPPPPPN